MSVAVMVPAVGTWLSSLLDPTVPVQLFKKAREEDDGLTGQIVNYGGRAVAEVTSQRVRTSPITFVRASATDAAQLQAWWLANTPLLMRDTAGWYRAGVLFGGKITTLLPGTVTPQRFQVDVTFSDIDWVWGV